MKDRCKEIINELYRLNKWCTGTILGSRIGVSSRTIRSYIDKINQRWGNIILSHKKYGYKLVDKQGYLNVCVLHEKTQTPDRRLMYIFKRLFEGEQVIEDIGKQLFISRSTLEADLSKIKQVVKSYQGLTFIRKRGTVSLVGVECVKRKLYRNLLAMELNSQIIDTQHIIELYSRIDMKKIIDIFENVLEEKEYHIRSTALPMLYMHIGIMVERILQQQFLSIDDVLEVDCLEYGISDRFLTQISIIYDQYIPHLEKRAFAHLLKGYRTERELDNEMIFKGKLLSIKRLVDIVLKKAYEYSGVDFSKDPEFVRGIHLHLQGLLKRIQRDIRVKNSLVGELKQYYPLVFDTAIYIAQYLQIVCKQTLFDDEIAFLALHLGSAYTRLAKRQQIQVILVAGVNELFIQAMTDKLGTLFQQRLNIVKVVPYWKDNLLNEYDIDLIISVGEFFHIVPIPVAVISGLMSQLDERKLFSAIQQVDDQMLQTAFSVQSECFMKDPFFYRHPKVCTSKGLIAKMGKTLIEQGIVKEEFIESVLAREKLSSTSFKQGVAIPHALESHAKTSVISIAILDKPILWGENMVRLVIMPSIAKQDIAFLPLFFRWLSDTMENPSRLSQLMHAKTMKEFIDFCYFT